MISNGYYVYHLNRIPTDRRYLIANNGSKKWRNLKSLSELQHVNIFFLPDTEEKPKRNYVLRFSSPRGIYYNNLSKNTFLSASVVASSI